MKIRLTGTEAEIAAVLARLITAVEVQEISGFYPNRGASVLGRVYVTIAIPPADNQARTVRAVAERLDHTRRRQLP